MNMKYTIKKHLLCLLRSRSLFAGILYQNRYFLIPIFICMVGSLIFNSTLEYFIDISLYELNLLSFILYLVIIYLVYIKFILFSRIFILFKSIKFFNRELNKLIQTKDIKLLMLYYYLINLFGIIISLFIINRIDYNLEILNLYPYLTYTTIISLVLFLTNLKRLWMREFEIVNQKENINIIFITINILILCYPFICIHLLHETLIIYFEDYLIKYFTIYCDSKEDLEFKNKLKDPNTQFTIHSSAPTKQSIKIIDEIGPMNPLFFYYIITEYNINNEFLCNAETYTKFINHPYITYQLDPQIIDFINNNLDLIDNHNISKEDLKDYLKTLYPLELDYNQTISYIKTLHSNNMLNVGNGLIAYFINVLFSWFIEDYDIIHKSHEKQVQEITQYFELKSEQRLQPRLSKDEYLVALLDKHKLANNNHFGYNNSNASSSSISSIDSQKTIEHKRNN
uniref:Uncharacterized protein n=1 Tax=Tricholoma saponaceum TaxID=113602 RepID=A0A6C0W3T0_9AGAR|nr:hypothetical protein [Tricholoma saponaceum]QIC20297.1 hypothetical protein [Tricholoma saponaceum]